MGGEGEQIYPQKARTNTKYLPTTTRPCRLSKRKLSIPGAAWQLDSCRSVASAPHQPQGSGPFEAGGVGTRAKGAPANRARGTEGVEGGARAQFATDAGHVEPARSGE